MAVFNGRTPAEIQAQIARIERILLKYEVRARRRIRREIMRLWRQFDTLSQSIQVFEENITEILSQTYEETAKEFAPFISGQIEDNGSDSVVAPVLAGLIIFNATRSQEASTQIVQTELSNMRDLARVLAQDGLSQADIAQEIRNRAPTYSLGRADLIAETEVRQLADEVTRQSIEESGLEITQAVWLSAGDNRVRESHRDANNQVRPIGEPFDVGGEKLRYPRDPNGSAMNTLRCRCVLNYLTE